METKEDKKKDDMNGNYNRRRRRTPKSIPIKRKFNWLLPTEDNADT